MLCADTHKGVCALRKMTKQTNLACSLCLCAAVWKVMLQELKWELLWTLVVATVVSQ